MSQYPYPGPTAPPPYAQQQPMTDQGYGPTPYPVPPSSGTGWVIAAFLLFWPTAIPALFASQRAERALGAGDWNAAAAEGARAKKFGIISLSVFGGLIVLQLLFLGLWISAMAALINEVSYY